MTEILFPAGADEETQQRTVTFFSTYSPDEMGSLVKAGICLEAKSDGNSVLEHAAWHGAVNAFSDLLALGADPTESKPHSFSNLHSAAFGYSKQDEDYAKIIHKLIAYGAEIEGRNGDGRTALWITGGFPTFDDNEYDRLAQCRALLAHGANIYATDKSGRMAIEGQPMAERLPELAKWKRQYEEFAASRFTPGTAEDVYQLLSVYPLKNPEAQVDREAHLRQIFAHARWKDEAQVAGIIRTMENDGMTATTSESLYTLAVTAIESRKGMTL